VREAETTDINAVRNTIRHQSLDAPEGIVTIDFDTNHTWRPSYIAQARSDGQFDIRWTSQTPVRPTPYPLTRTKADWDQFLDDLFQKWDRTWSNPRDTKDHKTISNLKLNDPKKLPNPKPASDSPPVIPPAKAAETSKTKAQNGAANTKKKPARKEN
jgi:hypothetical protein